MAGRWVVMLLMVASLLVGPGLRPVMAVDPDPFWSHESSFRVPLFPSAIALDPQRGLWVAMRRGTSQGDIVRYSSYGTPGVSIPFSGNIVSRVSGMCMDGDVLVVAAGGAGGQYLVRFDANGVKLGTLAVPGVAWLTGVDVDSNGDYLVSDVYGGRLLRIDRLTGAQTAFGAGDVVQPRQLVHDADSGDILVTDDLGVVRFNGDSTFERRYTLPKSRAGLETLPGGVFVAAGDFGTSGAVGTYRSDGTPVHVWTRATSPEPNPNWLYDPRHVAFDEANARMYIAFADGVIQTYRTNQLDTEPPTSAIDFSGTRGMNDWFVGPVQVTISATDAGTGVERIEYSQDGGATWVTYSGPFVLPDDGRHSVTYRAVDRAGNVESSKTAGCSIDQTPPTVVVSSPQQGATVFAGSPLPFVWITSDLGSGVDAARTVATAPSGGLLPTPLGDHEAFVRVYDLAGNTAIVRVEYAVPWALTVSAPSVNERGSTIQVELQVGTVDGPAVGLEPRLYYRAVGDVDWLDATGGGSTNVFAEPQPGTYRHGWKTPKVSGAYEFRVVISGIEYIGVVQLTENGRSGR